MARHFVLKKMLKINYRVLVYTISSTTYITDIISFLDVTGFFTLQLQCLLKYGVKYNNKEQMFTTNSSIISIPE